MLNRPELRNLSSRVLGFGNAFFSSEGEGRLPKGFSRLALADFLRSHCLLFLLTFFAAPACCISEEEMVWSGPGYLLLKNGNIILGKDIFPQNQSVLVRIDDSAEIRFPAKEVVHIGRDVKALYEFQVANTLKWEVGEHFHLAKWCLKNGLVEDAYGHYVQVKALSSGHTKFRQFETELREYLLQDPVMQAALKATYPDSPYVKKASSEVPDQENKDTPVQQKSSPAIAISPIHQDYFRRQVQPFMVLRCGQAGCHGPLGKTDFTIGKSGSLKGRPAGEISLETTLKFLDHPQTEATQLWIKATTRHGMQPASALSVDDKAERELLERLRYWHQSMVATPKPIAAQAMLAANPLGRNEKAAASNSIAESSKPSTAVDKGDAESPAMLESEVGSELLALEREIAKLEEKEKARKQPTNRHDPEEYNRRFLNPLR